MKRTSVVPMTVLLLLGLGAGAHAAVLCTNPSGSVFVRATCNANEQTLDLAALGLTGPPGPQGPSGVSGYEIVTHQEFIAPTPFANIHVECPAGKKVLGGGFSIETPDDVKVFASEPSDGAGNLIDHGWTISVKNVGASSRQVTATAMCALME